MSHARIARRLAVGKGIDVQDVEVDEIWGYVFKKEGHKWDRELNNQPSARSFPNYREPHKPETTKPPSKLERLEKIKMTENEQEKTLEFIVSHLALLAEQTVLRVEAFRQVMAEKAPQLMLEVDVVEERLSKSPLQQRCTDLRNLAIQAVRDQDTSALSEYIADLRGQTRLRLHKEQIS